MKNPLKVATWVWHLFHAEGLLKIAEFVVLLGVGFGAAWGLKPSEPAEPSDSTADKSADAPSIWTCSMHPQIRRDKPGKCPICGMNLVPVESSSSGGMRTITISPDAKKLMEIQTSPVERKYVTAELRMVGKVVFDETRLSYITAWVSGRLDRLYVDYTGIEVKAGDHLVYVYSEELYAAQEELIQALKHRRERGPKKSTLIQPIDLVASSREKLRLLGLTVSQIKEIENRGTPSDHITIFSSISGVVIDKLKQEGDRVRTGDRIYTVADLKQVWVKLDAYESDLVWLRYGQEVEFTTEAFPGETFTGRISFIDPVLNKNTRTVKVRVNVPNKDGRLKPEMFVKSVVRSRIAAGGRVLDSKLIGKWISPMHPEIVEDKPGNCPLCGMPLVRAETLGYVTASASEKLKPLVIPVSAALVTGTRAIVYVQIPNQKKPTFEGREILLGPRAGDYYLVRSGLKEGELVVTNGNFKLDSALQISAKPSMMTPEGGGGGGGHHHGGGQKKKKAKSDGGNSKKMTLPEAFRTQLEDLFAAYQKVTSAVEEADLAKIRAAFVNVGVSMKEVDSKPLADHMKMLWKEFSMLMGNDVLEGRDVHTMQEADRIYLLLKRNIERIREQFGLKNTEHEVAKLEVPAEFQSQLLRLWKAYLPIEKALAVDDYKKARESLARVKSVVAAIPAKLLTGDTLKTWQKEYTNLLKIVSLFEKSTDLEQVRSAFALLSDELLVLVKSFGVGNTDSIYELHCPMAFKGRGASWLQDSELVRNPYLGLSMPKCHDKIERIISPRAAQPADGSYDRN